MTQEQIELEEVISRSKFLDEVLPDGRLTDEDLVAMAAEFGK